MAQGMVRAMRGEGEGGQGLKVKEAEEERDESVPEERGELEEARPNMGLKPEETPKPKEGPTLGVEKVPRVIIPAPGGYIQANSRHVPILRMQPNLNWNRSEGPMDLDWPTKCRRREKEENEGDWEADKDKEVVEIRQEDFKRGKEQRRRGAKGSTGGP